MLKRFVPAALAGLMVSLDAGAASGHLDAYFVPSSNLEISVPEFFTEDDDGDGFGVRGLAPLSETAALTGEYQSTSYDAFGIDFDQLRVGVGLTGKTRSGIFVEYIDADLAGSRADGFGLHGRLEGESGAAGFYGQIGYLKLNDDAEDLTGLEFVVGIALPFNQNLSGFIDMRRTTLEGSDSEVEFTFTDFRAGVRINI